MLLYHLVVQNPFEGYARGDQITDPETVKKVLESEHEGHVIKIAGPVTETA